MRLINKVTFEIKDINIDQIKLLVNNFENRYDSTGKQSIELLEIDSEIESLILAFVKQKLGKEWVLESEFNNWLAIDFDDKKYIHRVIVTPNQLVKITEEFPEFITMIKSGVQNPWAALGSMREVYLTKFETGVRECLENPDIFNPIVICEDKQTDL